MNFPFFSGLLFAAVEQSSSAVARHMERFRAEEFADGIVFELPKFFAFGFLAGVGADWLLDKTQNRAVETIVAVAICIGVLCLSSCLRRNGLHLGALFQRETLRAWKLNAFLIGVLAFAAASFPYLFFSNQLGLHFGNIVTGVLIVGFIYIVVLVVRTVRVCKWEGQKAARIAERTLHAYCQFLPDRVARVSTNPDAHAGLGRFELGQKLIIVEREYKASVQCCCLENYLVDIISEECLLPESWMRSIVREHIKKLGSEVMIEKAALHVLIGSKTEKANASDLLQRNGHSKLLGSLKMLEERIEADSASQSEAQAHG